MAKLDYMGITWKYGFGTKFKWVPWKISGKFPGFPLKAKLHFHQSTRASHIAIWKMGGSWIFSIFETLLSNSFPLTRAGPPVVIPVGPRAPHAGTLNNIRHQTCDMIVKHTSKKEKKCAAAFSLLPAGWRDRVLWWSLPPAKEQGGGGLPVGSDHLGGNYKLHYVNHINMVGIIDDPSYWNVVSWSPLWELKMIWIMLY